MHATGYNIEPLDGFTRRSGEVSGRTLAGRLISCREIRRLCEGNVCLMRPTFTYRGCAHVRVLECQTY